MSRTEVTFPFCRDVREKFISEDSLLLESWAARYEGVLFDAKDISTARSQAPLKYRKPDSKRRWGGYHFYEWLAAILIYKATGLRSLVESYPRHDHELGKAVLTKLFNEEQLKFLSFSNLSNHAQAPDLLVYRKDYSSYLFCEVKGPKDTLSDAADNVFREIEQRCTTSVIIIHFIDSKAKVEDEDVERVVDNWAEEVRRSYGTLFGIL